MKSVWGRILGSFFKIVKVPHEPNPNSVEEEQQGLRYHSSDDDKSDAESITSTESEGSVMEPFESYKTKIEQLLQNVGLSGYSIEVIQHGYDCMNCVYALRSPKNQDEYILRVATGGIYDEISGTNETVESEVIVLGFLKDKLPVPRVKAYSLTADNVLESAYTVQTRIEGQSLNHVWANMESEDKFSVIDEFVNLLVTLESITFDSAGTIAASAPLPAGSHHDPEIAAPAVQAFDALTAEPTENQELIHERHGKDLKLFLSSSMDKWIQDEKNRDDDQRTWLIGPRLQKLKSMLDEMEDEGAFTNQPSPIILHHSDLEPRNLMVSKASGTWKITGIIDWDDALALPRPLARIPPRWIWHFPDEDPDIEDGYLNDDQYLDPVPSDENAALKAYFDEKVETVLPGYGEDANGNGRWLRRIWCFAREGACRTWQWPFLDQLPEDWAARYGQATKKSA